MDDGVSDAKLIINEKKLPPTGGLKRKHSNGSRNDQNVGKTLAKKFNYLKPKPVTASIPVATKLNNDDGIATGTLFKQKKSGELVSPRRRSGRKINPKPYLLRSRVEPNNNGIRKTPITMKSGGRTQKGRRKIQKCVTNKSTDALKLAANKIIQIEQTLVELDGLVKSTIRLAKAEPDKCIKYLKKYKNLNITSLMLKKHPYCVETMNKLRRYIGNITEWDLSHAEADNFRKKSQKIRSAAEEIYSKFKRLFPIPSQKKFSVAFTDEVNKLKEKTKHLTEIDVLALTEEPDSVKGQNNSSEPQEAPPAETMKTTTSASNNDDVSNSSETIITPPSAALTTDVTLNQLEKCNKKDSYDKFGEIISERLRYLKLTIARRCECELLTVLAKYEIENSELVDKEHIIT